MIASRIVLADDHPFLLEGLQNILKEEASLEIVACVQNGIELMNAVLEYRPEIVIMDLNMPGFDGLQCLRKIKTNYPETKILVLTNYNQPELVEEVDKMQGDGFLVKNCSSVQLKEAIAIILSGGKYFPGAQELKPVVENSYFFDSFLKKYQLTKREVEIIKMVCNEKGTKQIAEELFLSEFTIQTHRRNILRKVEVKNVAGLINFARENCLL